MVLSLVCGNAFWLTKCNENEMKSRLDSSSKNLLVLYKDQDNGKMLPVGFAHLLTTVDRSLTYVSDVVVARGKADPFGS